jgi:hypothetical protein
MKKFILNLSLVTFSILVGFGVVELSLIAVDAGGLYKSGISRLHDAKLRYRLPPNHFPEIDANGFRNYSSDDIYDVVVLGDSHAYGYGVVANETFPALLSELSGLNIYNYGMGGFGPAQYFHLSKQALEKSPKILVISVFMGNDMVNACNIGNQLAYWNAYFNNNRLSSKSCGGEFVRTPIKQWVEPDGISRNMKAFLKSTRTGSLINQFLWLPIRTWLQTKSGLWEDKPVIVTDDKLVRSIFGVWPNHTVKAREGLGITKHFLEKIILSAQKKDSDTILLILPSKQNVYFEHLKAAGYKLPAGFVESVSYERKFSTELIQYAIGLGATGVSAYEQLSLRVKKGQKLYPNDDDSHPVAAGYRAYAETLLTTINTLDRK